MQGRSTLPALKCHDGVKQGCVLSPSLFPLAVDWNFSRWRRSRWLTSTLQVTYTDINAGEDWRDAQIRHPDLIWHTFKAKITKIPTRWAESLSRYHPLVSEYPFWSLQAGFMVSTMFGFQFDLIPQDSTYGCVDWIQASTRWWTYCSWLPKFYSNLDKIRNNGFFPRVI